MQALRPARRARDARHRLARDRSPRCAPAARRRTAASTSQMAHLGPENVRRQFKGMVERCADCGFDLAGGLVEVVPTAHYMMGGVVFAPDCTTDARRALRRRRGHGRRARREPARRQRRRQLDGVRRHRRRRDGRRGSRRSGEFAEPDGAAVDGAIAARAAPFGQPRGDLRGDPRARSTTCMWDDVGIVRDGPGLRRAPAARSKRSHERLRAHRRRRCDAPLQPHLARLAQPREPDRG